MEEIVDGGHLRILVQIGTVVLDEFEGQVQRHVGQVDEVGAGIGHEEFDGSVVIQVGRQRVLSDLGHLVDGRLCVWHAEQVLQFVPSAGAGIMAHDLGGGHIRRCRVGDVCWRTTSSSPSAASSVSSDEVKWTATKRGLL